MPLQTNIPLEGGQTVANRARPELDPSGFRFGQFFFFPRLELDEAYDDNIFATRSGIFATRSGHQSDFITVLAPAFDIRSDFGTNALDLSAGAIIAEYISHSSFDTQDPYIKADGRLDVDAATISTAATTTCGCTRTLARPLSPGTRRSPCTTRPMAAPPASSRRSCASTIPSTSAPSARNTTAVPAVGGGLVQESERNDWAYELALRGAYEFRTGYQAFVRGAANLRDYDHAAIGSPIRSSYGYRADVGVRIDLTGVTYVDAYVGYFDQIYELALLGSISGPDFGANAVWNVTELTSLSFNVSRNVEDAPTAASVPRWFRDILIQSSALASIMSCLRNLLLNGQVTYANDDFQGEDRTDSDYLASIGAKYLLNRNLYLGATYTFEHRDSSGAQAINQFTRNIFMLRASTQF